MSAPLSTSSSTTGLPILSTIARMLRRQHPRLRRPPPRTAFQWVLWDNVAYLADDARRLAAYTLLKKTVGLSPQDILDASNSALLEVTRHGIVAPLFARKLRSAAEIARDRFGSRVEPSLDADAGKAAKQLRAFPGVGEPGAEKILVAIGRARTLPLDSNGLRVLLRMGFGQSLRSYAATYRSVKTAMPIGKTTAKSLFETHLLLQQHGRTICKTSQPLCSACQLRPICAFGRGSAISFTSR